MLSGCTEVIEWRGRKRRYNIGVFNKTIFFGFSKVAFIRDTILSTISLAAQIHIMNSLLGVSFITPDLILRVLFYYRGSEHIGVESIIAYLKSKGHLVELIFEPALGDNGYIDIPSLNKFFYNDELVVNKAIRFRPDLIAFSAITNLYMPIKNLARKFKQVLPDVPIICGGIHPTSLPEESIKEDSFDMICLGEGEGAMEDLLQRMREKRSYTDVKNLWV